MWSEVQLKRSLRQLVEGRRQLEAVLEQRDPSEHVEAEARTGHGDDETTDVAQMAHGFCLDQRQQNVVVLLTLVTIHRRHLQQDVKCLLPLWLHLKIALRFILP